METQMKNLAPRSRKSGLSFVYDKEIPGESRNPTKIGTDAKDKVRISVSYELGGSSAFAGMFGFDPSGRGVFVHVTKVTSEGGFESFMLGHGLKVMAKPLGRKSDKQIQAVAETIDDLVEAMADAYIANMLDERGVDRKVDHFEQIPAKAALLVALERLKK
jgi:hypothetical protein